MEILFHKFNRVNIHIVICLYRNVVPFAFKFKQKSKLFPFQQEEQHFDVNKMRCVW